jgi:exodeoxyribonuclease VIII
MKRAYLSTSALKAFSKSPNHCLAYYAQTIEPTPAMQLGSAVHCAILEPDKLKERYVVAPQVDRRTKEGKAEWEAFTASAGERTVLTREQGETLAAVTAAVFADPISHDLINACTTFEEEIIGQILGTPYKGILDMRCNDFIADIKTCTDASAEAFSRQAFNLMYHEQAAAYAILAEKPEIPFYFIAVETSPPYNTQVFKQSEASRTKATHHLHQLIRRWQEWDGNPATYTNTVTTLEIPHWAK